MVFRQKILGVFLVFCLSLFASSTFTEVLAQKLAIHVTQAELDIWKQRTTNGPYKDGWPTIISRADATADATWAGNTTTNCYNPATHGTPGRTRHRGLRDAGLAYLVTGTVAYRDKVRTMLLKQAAVAGTDFSNSTKWCLPSGDGGNQETVNWLRRLIYAYDYIRPTLSSVDRATLDKWFLNAANFFEAQVHSVISTRFSGRLNDNYTCTGSSGVCGATGGNDAGILYFGGPMVKNFHTAWANKAAARAAFFGAAGVVLNNPTLKDRAKRFVQEWIKYGTWPGGAIVDMNRWNGSTPQNGYGYSMTALGSVLSIVDHLARDGDISLYTFSTSDGLYGTQGGPKSLFKILQYHAGLTNGSILRYASTVSTTDKNLLIDPFGPTLNNIGYIHLAPGNLFYKDDIIKKAYLTPIPSTYMNGGYDPLGGDWGSYSHILFMFGQQENVFPYSTGTSQPSAPAAPSELRVVGY